MRSGASFRGQPVLLIILMLAGWCALRAASWQTLEGHFTAERFAASNVSPAAPVFTPEPDRAALADARTGRRPASHGRAEPAQQATASGQAAPDVSLPSRPLHELPAFSAPADDHGQVPPPLDFPAGPAIAPAAERSGAQAVVGHNLLLMAGLSQMQVPAALLAHLEAAEAGREDASKPMEAAARTGFAARPAGRHEIGAGGWSIDGWLLLRGETNSPLLSGRPSYGRSQAGAVLRYRLAPASGHRPEAFARAATTIRGTKERDLALGLSARPLPSLPLRAAAELRVSERQGGSELRPAAFVVSEFPPFKLPLGGRGEAYFAAGHVRGDFATSFVEGQARVERPLGRIGDAELAAGAGAWGGAQKGASRLDVGPSAAVSFRLGEARSRLALDYRFRVAGDAEPASGPALTLSAGF